MSENYVKLVMFVRKKEGMSFEDFKNYYETKHSKLIRHMPRVQRYMRRYLHPLVGQIAHVDDSGKKYDFDAITELWFKSREDLDTAMARFAEPELAEIFREDEEKFIDRSRITINIVDEHVSDLAVDGHPAS